MTKPARKTAKAQAAKPARNEQDASYNAAGFDRKGVLDVVDGEEYRRRGTVNYPWEHALKSKMVEACNGLASMVDIIARIKELAPNA